MQTTKLSDIVADTAAQPRAELDPFLVDEYAEAMKRGDEFPAVVLFEGKDGKLYLADGFHRRAAAEEAGLEEIAALVHKTYARGKDGKREEGLRAAILYSCGANAEHGKRRTNADKRRAVEALLGDSEWKKRSARWIAEACRVGKTLVAEVRSQLSGADSDGETTVLTRNGRRLNVANIGRRARKKIASSDLLEYRGELELLGSQKAEVQVPIAEAAVTFSPHSVKKAVALKRRERRDAERAEISAKAEAEEAVDLSKGGRKIRDLSKVLGRYRTVYLDPPWAYEDATVNGGAAHQYETMSVEEMLADPDISRVRELLTASGGHVWTWTTWPMIRDGSARRLLEGLGLEWTSELVWDKDRLLLGRWLRVQTEVLILSAVGEVPRMADDVRGIIRARSGEHSAKPEAAYAVIERFSPGPRIELFSRGPRKGWHRWGKQA